MKGSVTLNKAVVKAYKISKRQGKWSNLPEIDAKVTPKTFSQPELPILRHLVKLGKIEKKVNVMMWRPTNAAGAMLGSGNSSKDKDRDGDRGKDRGKDKGKDRTHRDRPEKPTRRRGKPDRTHRTRKGKSRRRTNRRDSKTEKGIRRAGRVTAATSVLSSFGGGSIGSSVGRSISNTFM